MALCSSLIASDHHGIGLRLKTPVVLGMVCKPAEYSVLEANWTPSSTEDTSSAGMDISLSSWKRGQSALSIFHFGGLEVGGDTEDLIIDGK